MNEPLSAEDYIGRTLRVLSSVLALPTGRDVLEGQTFKVLAEHVARGARPDLWIAVGNAEVVDDVPQRVPTPGRNGSAPAAPAAPAAAPASLPADVPPPAPAKGA